MADLLAMMQELGTPAGVLLFIVWQHFEGRRKNPEFELMQYKLDQILDEVKTD